MKYIIEETKKIKRPNPAWISYFKSLVFESYFASAKASAMIVMGILNIFDVILNYKYRWSFLMYNQSIFLEDLWNIWVDFILLLT
jgi:hypothetical protein